MNNFKKTINDLKKLKEVSTKSAGICEDPLSVNITDGVKSKEYTFFDKEVKIEFLKNALERDIHLSYLDKNMQEFLQKVLNILDDNLFLKILERKSFKQNDIDFTFNKIYVTSTYESNADVKSIN